MTTTQALALIRTVMGPEASVRLLEEGYDDKLVLGLGAEISLWYRRVNTNPAYQARAAAGHRTKARKRRNQDAPQGSGTP